jgi:hypothetical protein
VAITETHKALRQMDFMLQIHRYIRQLNLSEGVSRRDWAINEATGRGDLENNLLKVRRGEQQFMNATFGTPYGSIRVRLDQSKKWEIRIAVGEPMSREKWHNRMSVDNTWTFNHVRGDHEELFDAIWDGYHAMKRLCLAAAATPLPLGRRDPDPSGPPQQTLAGM